MKKFRVNLKSLSKIRFKRREFKNLSARAAHDWRVMILVFSLLCILVVTLHLYLFFRIDEGEAFATSETRTEKKPLVDIKTLDEALLKFGEKEINIQLFRTSGREVVDPSL